MSLKVEYKHDENMEAGLDEAGRGCLWGPLYAAAVIWPPEEAWTDEHREIAPQIKDSKKLSAKKRAYLASAIRSLATDFGVGTVTPQEMDEHGMSYANRLAFQRAIQDLAITPDRILLDGILRLLPNQLKDLQVTEQETFVEGDGIYLPIAAASILAKESRDSAVRECVAKEPSLEEKYGLQSGKGYGTKKHREGILTHGKHSEHRNLFLRKLLGIKVETQARRLEDAEECLILDDR